eukprot:1158359-Pelagomonas_calceolata.AAC.10
MQGTRGREHMLSARQTCSVQGTQGHKRAQCRTRALNAEYCDTCAECRAHALNAGYCDTCAKYGTLQQLC